MKYFARLTSGIDVAPALAELDAHPELWGADPERLNAPGSPHVQSQDIWLRFRPRRELTSRAAFGEPHTPEWWPAWDALPALHPVVGGLCALLRPAELGGILLTRIPPGASILPHVDHGWHPFHFACKTYVVLRANPDCVNYCEEETVVMRAGEAWLFRNDLVHGVDNRGDTERISLIVTCRMAELPPP